MRFHIGFSKFIRPSQLIKWLGILFLGFLAFIGYDRVNAATLHTATNVNLGSYIHSYFEDYYSKSCATCSMSNLQSRTESITWSSDSYGVSDLNIIATKSYWQFYRHLDYEISTNMCSSVNGSKSMDLYFNPAGRSYSYINQILSDSGFQDITSISDIVSVGITPIFSGDGPFAEYSCNISNYEDNLQYPSWGKYTVACIGVPVEGVLGYKLSYYNNLAYNFEPEELSNNIYTDQPTVFYQIVRKYDYACSDVEPVRPDQPLEPSDFTGSSNITLPDYESDGSGASALVNDDTLYLSWYNDLDIPESLTNLMVLPFNLISLISNDAVGVCQPLELDLSSITRRWGNFNYSLQIPCMRAYISNLLNTQILGTISLYNLADMFTAAFLALWLGQKTWFAIQDMLSGRDIHKYLIIG